jgi:hypothetical protein
VLRDGVGGEARADDGAGSALLYMCRAGVGFGGREGAIML